MNNQVTIEFVSDFACPWCYIGKRRLDKAIRRLRDMNISLQWRPFQLNPQLPREGMNRRDYYRQKFSPEHLQAMRSHLHQAGTGEGIRFCDDPDAIAPNTFSAHLLMLLASEDGSIDMNVLAENLFHAHHIACESIADHEVLARIATESGMDGNITRSKLAADYHEKQVREQVQLASEQGITGVPFFIINSRYGLSGAQPADALVSTFTEAAKEHL